VYSHICARAKESLKWGMPAFSYRRILVTFGAFKHHIGFFPTPSAVRAFANDLSKFATASVSVQFPLEKPLPLPLIRKITAFRVRESIEKDGKWKTDGKLYRKPFPTVNGMTSARPLHRGRREE
jgi:uncharacterized protein YdhG (YjbR/CyaY superfamily)